MAIPFPDDYTKGGAKNFELGYDMWWLYENSALRGKNVGGESDFKMIRSSIGLEAPVENTAEASVHVCNCVAGSSNCGDTCMNRLMYTECWAKACP
jgi:histone-lysine N-methyltransferase ASH1L